MSGHRQSLLRTLPAVAVRRAAFSPSHRNGLANLALGKPATQSSISPRWSARETAAEEAARGNTGVAMRARGLHSDKQPFPWWQVDLGAIARLSEVLIYNRRENADRLSRFSILVSLDGRQWVEAFRKSDDSVFGVSSLAPYVAKLPAGCIGQFLRVQANANTFLHFSECAVYGAIAPEAETPALQAAFDQTMALEEQRMCGPSALTDPAEIDLELVLTQRMHPFPPNALRRTDGRAWILDYARPDGVGAEVGVFRGHFSEVILRKLKPKKFYLVDPWRKLGESFEIGGEYSHNRSLPTALAKQEVELRTRKYPETECVIIEEFFPEGVHIAEPLDWIYLDASHSYDRTRLELQACAKLLGPDACIMGDDFWPFPGAPHPGVVRALNEFVDSSDFRFVAGGPYGQWCLRRRSEDPPPTPEPQSPA